MNYSTDFSDLFGYCTVFRQFWLFYVAHINGKLLQNINGVELTDLSAATNALQQIFIVLRVFSREYFCIMTRHFSTIWSAAPRVLSVPMQSRRLLCHQLLLLHLAFAYCLDSAWNTSSFDLISLLHRNLGH